MNRLVNAERVILTFLTSLLTQGTFAVWLITNHMVYTAAIGVIAVIFQVVLWSIKHDRNDSGVALTVMLQFVGVIAVYVLHLKGDPIGYSFSIAFLISVWEYACIRAENAESITADETTETAEADKAAETTETDATAAETTKTAKADEAAETTETDATATEDKTGPTLLIQIVHHTAPLLPLLVAAGITSACVLVTLCKKK